MRAKASRRLLLESLEARNLLAIDIQLSNSTIYEGGPSGDFALRSHLKIGSTLIQFNIHSLQINPPPEPLWDISESNLKLTFTGQVDAYALYSDNYFLAPIVQSDNEAVYNFPGSLDDGGNFDPIYLEMVATDDETIAVPSTPQSLFDAKDFDVDPIVIKAELMYSRRAPFPNSNQSVSFTDQNSKTVSIQDNDFQRLLTLSTDDGSAQEPFSIFYAPRLPLDTGRYKIDVPVEWRGGNVLLATSGTATDGADYTLSVDPSNPLPPNSFEKQPDGRYRLSIPSRESDAGHSTIRLLLTPLANALRNEGNESATLSFSPATQRFVSSVVTGLDFDYGSDLYRVDFQFDTTGSGTVTIVEKNEAITITTDPSSVKEYAASPDYGHFRVRPADLAEILNFSSTTYAYLEFTANTLGQSGTKNSAIPGLDYNLRLNNAPLPIQLVNASTGLYRTDPFRATGQSEIDIQLIPVEDKFLEDDETVEAKLFTSVNSIATQFGSGTITIEELYVRDRQESSEKDEQCGCSCVCTQPGINFTQDKEDGSVKVQSSLAPVSFVGPNENGQFSKLYIGLPLHSNKAIPTRIDVERRIVEEDPSSQDKGSELGSKPISGGGNLLGNFVLYPEGSQSGDVIWFVAETDLTASLSISVPSSNRNAAGDTLINVRLLAHPEFASGATTDQRLSGWLGYHSFVMANFTTGNVNADSRTTLTGYSTVNPKIGPSGINLFGLKRAIVNARMIVPKISQSSVPLSTQVVLGKNRVGAAVRFRGHTIVQLATAVIHEDGATTIFNDGSSVRSLSKIDFGNTFVDRYNSKAVFDASGHQTQRIDSQGNITNFTYDSEGWVASMIDSYGNPYRLTKISSTVSSYTLRLTTQLNRAVLSDSINTYVDLVWTGSSGATLGGNTGSLLIKGVDPDGISGPRKALFEKLNFSVGILSSVERGEEGGPTIQSLSFSFGYLPGATNRGVSTITRQDGATQSLDVPFFRDKVIAASFTNTILLSNSTSNSPGGPISRKLFVANDALVSPFESGLAVAKDWNGNQTIYRLDSRGRILAMWDPIQVEALGLQNLLPSDSLMETRLGQWPNLAYRYDLAIPSKDTWGVVTSGKDFGEATKMYSPDPDLVVFLGTQVSNGSKVV